MSDTRRADRVIPFTGGILADTVGPGDSISYVENLVPSTSSNVGLDPREGIEWLYTLPIVEGRINNTCCVYLVTLDDVTRQKLVVVQDPNTKEILHLTKYSEQAGVSALPPYGCGHASLDDPGGEGCHLPVTPTPAPEFGNLLYFEQDAYDVQAGDIVTLTVKGVNQGGTASWSTEDDSAKAGTDYTANTGAVTASDSNNGSINVQTAIAGLGKTFQVYLYDPQGGALLKNPSMCEVNIGTIPSLRFLTGPAYFMPATDNFHVLMMDEATLETKVVNLSMGTLNWDADNAEDSSLFFFDETPYYLVVNLYIDPATTSTTPGHWLVAYSLADILADPTATATPVQTVQIPDHFYRNDTNCPTAVGCDGIGHYYFLDTTSAGGYLSYVDLATGVITSVATDFLPESGFYKDNNGPFHPIFAEFDSRGNLVVTVQTDISASTYFVTMVIGPDGVINLPDTTTYPPASGTTGTFAPAHVAPSSTGTVHLYNMADTSPNFKIVTYDFSAYTETVMTAYVTDISGDGTRILCYDNSGIAIRNFPGESTYEQVENLPRKQIMRFINDTSFMATAGYDEVKIYATADLSVVATIDVVTLLADYYTDDQIQTTTNYGAYRARNIYGAFGGINA